MDALLFIAHMQVHLLYKCDIKHIILLYAFNP